MRTTNGTNKINVHATTIDTLKTTKQNNWPNYSQAANKYLEKIASEKKTPNKSVQVAGFQRDKQKW